jgi:hypothetical protein
LGPVRIETGKSLPAHGIAHALREPVEIRGKTGVLCRENGAEPISNELEKQARREGVKRRFIPRFWPAQSGMFERGSLGGTGRGEPPGRAVQRLILATRSSQRPEDAIRRIEEQNNVRSRSADGCSGRRPGRRAEYRSHVTRHRSGDPLQQGPAVLRAQ